MINTREIAEEYRLTHWARIMQERAQSGMYIKDFCKQAGICQNTYFYWQRRVRAAACEHLVKPEAVQKSLSFGGFTEVMVAEPPVSLPPAEPAPQLQIEYAGIVISADSGYPVKMLAALIQELRRPC
jgi:hypothetical protein